ncbi:hypothetical protein LMG10661_03649 [Ralstonia syzygii subsp. syzygii]|nr:hypothetical protein LMG10661_03649 [Ralstonia syzygii subsp. syzygii]
MRRPAPLLAIGQPDPASRIPYTGWPLFALGFRPFYLLAAGFAVIGMAASAALLLNWLPAVRGPVLAPLFWHAHEMVFGFAAAAVVGFLFTAGKNWTGRHHKARGWRGLPRCGWRALRLTSGSTPHICWRRVWTAATVECQAANAAQFEGGAEGVRQDQVQLNMQSLPFRDGLYDACSSEDRPQSVLLRLTGPVMPQTTEVTRDVDALNVSVAPKGLCQPQLCQRSGPQGADRHRTLSQSRAVCGRPGCVPYPLPVPFLRLPTVVDWRAAVKSAARAAG